jgi:hypothetical protein
METLPQTTIMTTKSNINDIGETNPFAVITLAKGLGLCGYIWERDDFIEWEEKKQFIFKLLASIGKHCKGYKLYEEYSFTYPKTRLGYKKCQIQIGKREEGALFTFVEDTECYILHIFEPVSTFLGIRLSPMFVLLPTDAAMAEDDILPTLTYSEYCNLDTFWRIPYKFLHWLTQDDRVGIILPFGFLGDKEYGLLFVSSPSNKTLLDTINTL